jgi:hypothetical protein
MNMNEIERRKYLALQAYYLEQKAALEKLENKLIEMGELHEKFSKETTGQQNQKTGRCEGKTCCHYH